MALELGPCQVAFGTAGAEVDLGKTMGGVTVTISDDSVDLVSDQYGSSAEDTVITGTTVEVSVNFAEVGLDLLNSVLQAQNTSPNSDFVAGENKVGTSLLAIAQSLKLTKYVSGAVSTDPADFITFPAAAPLGEAELTYDSANQRVVAATFKCFPATVNANWGTASAIDKVVTYYFGDETVTT